jgi:hypothetical protein
VELTANQLRDLIYEAATLAQDNLSYKICLIRRVDQDKISDNVYITPITDSIASKLPIRFRDLECHEQVGLYKDCAGMLSTRGMTGHLFAGYCQQRFQTKICLRFVAMVRLPDPNPTPAAEKRKLAGDTVHATWG